MSETAICFDPIGILLTENERANPFLALQVLFDMHRDAPRTRAVLAHIQQQVGEIQYKLICQDSMIACQQRQIDRLI